MDSQTKQILNHLKTGASLTSLQALSKFGCMRLSARVYDLKENGYPVNSHMISIGTNKKVASYRMALKRK